jgi:hypothetical protein
MYSRYDHILSSETIKNWIWHHGVVCCSKLVLFILGVRVLILTPWPCSLSWNRLFLSSFLKVLMYPPAQLLRNLCEGPSNTGDLDSSVTEEVAGVIDTGMDLLLIPCCTAVDGSRSVAFYMVQHVRLQWAWSCSDMCLNKHYCDFTGNSEVYLLHAMMKHWWWHDQIVLKCWWRDMRLSTYKLYK